MKFIKDYRQWPEGYELKEGEVSEAQMALLKKRGVIEQSGVTSENTKNEIMEYLDSKGVDYSPQMKKAELLELV